MNTPQDTVTPHHNIPNTSRNDNPAVVLSRVDIETIVDSRIADHIHQINEERRRAVREVREAKMTTMGVGAAVGLGLGIGTTLLVQRMRRRSAATK